MHTQLSGSAHYSAVGSGAHSAVGVCTLLSCWLSAGRLKILSEPDTYIARVQQEQMENDKKMIQHQINQQDAELAECTFQPAIHEAPSYVQRIARSMALTRSENTMLPTAGPDRGWR